MYLSVALLEEPKDIAITARLLYLAISEEDINAEFGRDVKVLVVLDTIDFDS